MSTPSHRDFQRNRQRYSSFSRSKHCFLHSVRKRSMSMVWWLIGLSMTNWHHMTPIGEGYITTHMVSMYVDWTITLPFAQHLHRSGQLLTVETIVTRRWVHAVKLNVVGTTPAVKYTMHRTDAYVQFQCNYIKNNKQHLTVESEGESPSSCTCIMNTPQTTAGHRSSLPCLPDVYSAVQGHDHDHWSVNTGYVA